MDLSMLMVALAALLFFLSTVPKIQRSWMIGIGLTLLACSMLPMFHRKI